MEDEDLIRQQMEQTRESITDKLETLEKKLSESVEEVSTVVTTAKETVHESVEAAKDFMDVKAHVQRHPWLMAGGAVAAGYVLGSILAQEKRAPPAPLQPVKAVQPPQGNGRHKPEKPAAQPEPTHWWSAFAPELEMLKKMALGAAISAVRDVVVKEAPPAMAEQVQTFFDKVTQKMGGDPLPPEPMTTSAACSSSSQSADEGSLDLEKPRW